jgi:hypothetical protein
MAQVGIVISCRGAAKRRSCTHSPSFGIASGISSNFGGQQRQPGIPTIIGTPTALSLLGTS